MKKNYHLYLGKAGHLAVMSEFLTRGWNVAIPEVDVGDDIFVVQDDNGILRRVQVKTATSTERHSGFSARFNIPIFQLTNISKIPVHYVFVTRHHDNWTKPLIIRQVNLLDHYYNGIGSKHDDRLILYFAYTSGKIECSGLDLSKYVSDYTDFPMIDYN